jgi:acyl-[acyl-carrier-protein]-phospholipid O-acyltransferase/long-chain-fatty-acid--[acyl-carrier-protein] ligase
MDELQSARASLGQKSVGSDSVETGWRALALGSAGLFFRLRHRVSVLGATPPKAGGVIWTNPLTVRGALALQFALGHRVRFMGAAEPFEAKEREPWSLSGEALPADPIALRAAALDAMTRGEWLCCCGPRGSEEPVRSLLEIGESDRPIAILPVWVDEPEPVRPASWAARKQITVVLGGLQSSKREVAELRLALLELGEAAFQERRELEGHLARAALRGLHRDLEAIILEDGLDGTRMRSLELLAAALALSRHIRREIDGPRVAIVLPPGKGAAVANLAVVLAGKVPVNLNFTAGREAVTAANRIAGLEVAVTARVFAEKLPEFPWPARLLYLEEELPKLRDRMGWWGILCKMLPEWALAGLLELPRQGDRAEAMVLFTSGSSGEPKGVVLSHRNLLGNVRQFSGMLGFERGSGVLACLPIFHSFGSTVTLWYPILEGMRMVTYPTPMDPAKNAELIERHSVALLCSTPTFLRGYLRKVEPTQLRSLQLVVTGAERLPMELADAFLERFGKPVMQGYGLTETSPVASVNLPNLDGVPEEERFRSRQRRGSVGKLAPGMAAQIRCPESGDKRSGLTTGMLWLRGPNIFEGYLGDSARTAEVLEQGWFRTGDLARFDGDGFLFIEGRLSRFSKIAGEMVPHETVESHLLRALGASPDDRSLIVTGVPETSKGEALVVLSTGELNLNELRPVLQAQGLPNLWLPRRWKRVSQIPVLATGKLDLQKIRELALANDVPGAV